MKIIAFYLPQYHEIPENNFWWGKGFTEWTNVKKSLPLFKNHRQPRIPLNNNYYSLEDIDTMKWQVSLAKKYRIDSFCFYHYWFNGKLLLEKPIERFFNHPEIDFEYCFSWANEPWTRSWDGKTRDILINQEYNGLFDIQNHFDYIKKFFLDKRYMKIENKPVFILYRANSIKYLHEMIELWNEEAKNIGFDGIYFIETLTGFQKEKEFNDTQALVYMEPMYSIGLKSKFRKLITTYKNVFSFNLNRREKYDSVWKRVLKYEKLSETQNAGAFVDWDNSPRKKRKNLVLTNVSPRKFYFYFKQQYIKALANKSNFIFINAWNEWAEGTYLEPDTEYQFQYLEKIRDIVNENTK